MPQAIEYVRNLAAPATTAVVMWDFQVGLAGRAKDLNSIVASARRLLDAADGAGMPVVWSRHTLLPPEDLSPGMQYFQMRKQNVATVGQLAPFMRPGSPEREFLPDLAPRPGDIVIDKSSPSFFVGTTLTQRLFSLGIRSLVFTGVATEIGVDLSAKHALALGYFPVIAADATGSYTDERQKLGLAALDSWLPVVSTDQLIELWRS